ncbi:MAG: anti-sigma F factor [Clostridia bacterium]|nr:anti-sigma F factor [Clostridia bacterium]
MNGRNKRKILNIASLTFPSVSQNESLARSFMSVFLMQTNPTVEEISDIKCAVSEAVTNSIVHGYRGTVGNIKMKAALYDDNTVVIDVTDKGCGIEDVNAAQQMLFTTNTDGERSGMGFTVMKTFTDRMKVYSKVGKGTRVRLEKKIGSSNT